MGERERGWERERVGEREKVKRKRVGEKAKYHHTAILSTKYNISLNSNL